VVFAAANDNGKLEYLEFCEIIAKNRKSLEQEEQELKDAFQIFDKNGDGTVIREELKEVFTDYVKPRLHDTTGCQTGCRTRFDNRFDNQLNEQWLFVQHGCQTGWMLVYTIQPAVKPVVQPD